jgi:Tol biopolymer transport system component
MSAVGLPAARTSTGSGNRLGSQTRSPRLTAAARVAAVLLAALVALGTSRHSDDAPQIKRVWSAQGAISGLAISPDGKSLLYVHAPEGERARVWLKDLGPSSPRRLTDDEDPLHEERGAKWAPGGGFSYVRWKEGHGSLYLVPPTGGIGRKLMDLPDIQGYDWMPDGKTVVALMQGPNRKASLFRIEAPSGSTRQLTFPSAIEHDQPPLVSPDGQWIAFLRAFPDASGVMVMPALGGAPKRIAHDFRASSLAWSPDSREIWFTGLQAGTSRHFYRVRLPDGHPQPVKFLAPEPNPFMPSISKDGRLAYLRITWRYRIWRYPLPGQDTGERKCVAESPAVQMGPEWSPDGRRLAFTSDRGGTWEIYVADREGSQPLQLTNSELGLGSWVRWSPDGRTLVTQAPLQGHQALYLVDADGGTSKVLTDGSDDAFIPEWSDDGRWIYYTRRDLKGNTSIWRVSPAGGTGEQVMNGGYLGFPSPDGTLLYTGHRGQNGIDVQPMGGGPASTAAEDASTWYLARARTGFYFVRVGLGPLRNRELMFFDYTSRLTRSVMTFPRPVVERGLSASRDGREILVTLDDGALSQLIVTDAFR